MPDSNSTLKKLLSELASPSTAPKACEQLLSTATDSVIALSGLAEAKLLTPLVKLLRVWLKCIYLQGSYVSNSLHALKTFKHVYR